MSKFDKKVICSFLVFIMLFSYFANFGIVFAESSDDIVDFSEDMTNYLNNNYPYYDINKDGKYSKEEVENINYFSFNLDKATQNFINDLSKLSNLKEFVIGSKTKDFENLKFPNDFCVYYDDQSSESSSYYVFYGFKIDFQKIYIGQICVLSNNTEDGLYKFTNSLSVEIENSNVAEFVEEKNYDTTDYYIRGKNEGKTKVTLKTNYKETTFDLEVLPNQINTNPDLIDNCENINLCYGGGAITDTGDLYKVDSNNPTNKMKKISSNVSKFIYFTTYDNENDKHYYKWAYLAGSTLHFGENNNVTNNTIENVQDIGYSSLVDFAYQDLNGKYYTYGWNYKTNQYEYNELSEIYRPLECISTIKKLYTNYYKILYGASRDRSSFGGRVNLPRYELDESSKTLHFKIGQQNDVLELTNVDSISAFSENYNGIIAKRTDNTIWYKENPFEKWVCIYSGEEKAQPVPDNPNTPEPQPQPQPQELKEIKFNDVKPTEWYYSAVQVVYSKGIVAGYNDTTFAPQDTVTRAQMVTFIWRMAGSQNIGNDQVFDDVGAETTFSTPIKWATQNGIVNGYGNGKFGPDDLVTRDQIAIMLMHYCQYKGEYKETQADFSRFGDSNQIPSWAMSAMNWAIGNRVITGNLNTQVPTLNPGGNATRAEGVAMIYKYFNNFSD